MNPTSRHDAVVRCSSESPSSEGLAAACGVPTAAKNVDFTAPRLGAHSGTSVAAGASSLQHAHEFCGTTGTAGSGHQIGLDTRSLLDNTDLRLPAAGMSSVQPVSNCSQSLETHRRQVQSQPGYNRPGDSAVASSLAPGCLPAIKASLLSGNTRAAALESARTGKESDKNFTFSPQSREGCPQPQSLHRLDEYNNTRGASTGCSPLRSTLWSMASDVPPPLSQPRLPPPARQEVQVAAGRLPPPPPPRQGTVPHHRQDRRDDGSGISLSLLSRVQSNDLSRDHSTGSRLYDAQDSSDHQLSLASSTAPEDKDCIKGLSLLPVLAQTKPESNNTRVHDMAASNAGKNPSHCSPSAVCMDSQILGLQKAVKTDRIDRKDTLAYRHTETLLPSSPLNRPSAFASTNVDGSARSATVSFLDTIKSINKSSKYFESWTPQTTLPSPNHKTAENMEKLDCSEDCNNAPGKQKTQVTTFVQMPLLMSSEVLVHGRRREKRAPSTRQNELVQSWNNRIQTGARVPRRQKSLQRSKSPSRSASNKKSAAPKSSQKRNGYTRPQDVHANHTRSLASQSPVKGLSFILFAVVALGYAKFLRPLHALRARRHFEEVITPAAAYRIQCRWRRYLQTRRIKQRTALLLLIPWLRLRLHRLRHVKLSSVLLLQRVLRGMGVRVRYRCLHQENIRNRALHHLRCYVQRWRAGKVLSALQIQRDEKIVLMHQCLQSYLHLFRAEQLEWNTIVQDGADRLQCRPCVSTLDWLEGVASLTGVVINAYVPNCNHATDAASFLSTRVGSNAAVILREYMSAVAGLLHQSPLSSETEELKDSRREKESVGCLALPQQEPAPSKDTSELMEDIWEGAPVTIRGGDGNPWSTRTLTTSVRSSDLATPPSPTTTVDALAEAHAQLLCRTEAMERADLKCELLHQHQELLRRPLLLNKAVHYTTSMGVPPIFLPLMIDMPSDPVLHHAARLFKNELEARCKIINLYVSMPLVCLQRPTINPASKARHNDLVRLLKGVDEPWADAERSEQSFFCKIAAHQRLVGSTVLTAEQQASSIPFSAHDSSESVSRLLTSTSYGTTSNDGDRHSPIHAVPRSPPSMPSVSHGTSNGICVRLNVARQTHHSSNAFITTSAPSYASPLLARIDTSVDSMATGGLDSLGRGEENGGGNKPLSTSQGGMEDARSRAVISSPHRRPRGPPLPLMRKAKSSHSGMFYSSHQSLSSGDTPAPQGREIVRELCSPSGSVFSSTAPSWLTPAQTPWLGQKERDEALDPAAPLQRHINTSFTAETSSNNDHCGSHRKDRTEAALCTAASVGNGCVATRCFIDSGYSPLCTSLSALSNRHPDDTAAGAGIAGVEPRRREQRLPPATASEATKAQTLVSTVAFQHDACVLSPSGTLWSSASTRREAGADGERLVTPSLPSCSPPTPPPRKRHGEPPKTTAN